MESLITAFIHLLIAKSLFPEQRVGIILRLRY